MQASTELADHHYCHLAKGLEVHCGGERDDGGWKGLRKMEKKAQENLSHAPKGLLGTLLPTLPLSPLLYFFLDDTDVVL